MSIHSQRNNKDNSQADWLVVSMSLFRMTTGNLESAQLHLLAYTYYCLCDSADHLGYSTAACNLADAKYRYSRLQPAYTIVSR